MKSKKSFEEIRDEVKGIRIGMFSSIYNGEIQSRPMAVQDMDEDNCLWFFTHTTDKHDKIDEVKENRAVQVSMVDTSNQTYYSINGTSTVVTDPDKIDQYWSLVAKAWFPDGKEDPGLVLLKVEAHKLAYWDSHSSKIVTGFQIAKALVTETAYDSGEHQTINL